jgi:hypothetical protein
MKWIRHLRGARHVLIGTSILGGALWSQSQALAYDRNAVVNYAEANWSGCNSYWPCYADDCTDFVSQAEWSGGLPMVGYPDKSDPWTWWQNGYGYAPPFGTATTSDSWGLTNNFYTYLDVYANNPVVYDYGRYAYSQYGDQMYTWANDGLSNGDMVFYDWTSDGNWDHSAVQVAYGTDNHAYGGFPAGHFYGSLVDEHTSFRQHVIWTLREFNNDYYATTTIGLMHVGA